MTSRRAHLRRLHEAGFCASQSFVSTSCLVIKNWFGFPSHLHGIITNSRLFSYHLLVSDSMGFEFLQIVTWEWSGRIQKYKSRLNKSRGKEGQKKCPSVRPRICGHDAKNVVLNPLFFVSRTASGLLGIYSSVRPWLNQGIIQMGLYKDDVQKLNWRFEDFFSYIDTMTSRGSFPKTSEIPGVVKKKEALLSKICALYIICLKLTAAYCAPPWMWWEMNIQLSLRAPPCLTHHLRFFCPDEFSPLEQFYLTSQRFAQKKHPFKKSKNRCLLSDRVICTQS